MPRLLVSLIAMVFAPAALAQSAEGRLKQLGETATVRLAYRSDANPFSFVNAKGEPDGYTVDLCKVVVKSLEQQLNARLAIAWVPVDTQNRIDTVAKGAADMECGSTTVSFERLAKVDFSSFIFMENTGLVVSANSKIFSVGDLGGKKVAAIAGTTNEAALAKELQRRKLDAQLIRVKDRREGMAGLESGAFDGFASDKLLLIGAQTADASAFRMLPENLSYELYAIVLPRGDWAFRLAVNTGLAQFFRAGKTNDLFERWFFGSRPGLLLEALYALGRISD